MLLLLSIPAFAFAGFLQAALQAWAPSNILIRRAKAAPPRWRTAAGLFVLSVALLLAVRALELAIAAGALDWLYIPSGILAWDAIKFGVLAVLTAARAIARAVAREGHSWERPARCRRSSTAAHPSDQAY